MFYCGSQPVPPPAPQPKPEMQEHSLYNPPQLSPTPPASKVLVQVSTYDLSQMPQETYFPAQESPTPYSLVPVQVYLYELSQGIQ